METVINKTVSYLIDSKTYRNLSFARALWLKYLRRHIADITTTGNMMIEQTIGMMTDSGGTKSDV